MKSAYSVNIVNSVKFKSVKSFSDKVSENLLPSPFPKISVKDSSKCFEEASFLSVQNFPPLEFRECPPMQPRNNLVGLVKKERCAVCKWFSCICQASDNSLSFLDSSEIDDFTDELKGGGRPKKVQIPKLRIVISEENENYDLLANSLRSFSQYWHLYDAHPPCKFSVEENCKFCAIRSLSLRLNGVKREPSIKPHEIERSKVQEFSLSMESLVNHMFPAMADAYSEFRKHSVLRVKCEDCQVILRIGESSILKSVYDHGDEELQDIVRSLIKRKMAFLPTCCDDFPDKFKIVEDQMFLFLMFEQPISSLGQSSVINVGNAEFQMLSCVSQTNRSVSESKNAIFKHKDLYLSQSAQDIVNVAFPGDIRNVSLIFLEELEWMALPA